MTPVSQCSICFLVLITVHKHDHTPHSMTTAESGRQEASVPPHPPTKREEPRDELCSSSAWPQTAPLTPRPVGRMGAVRACLKRRHSSAPVHARRAEGRALAGPEEGSGALGARRRWLAPVFSGVLRPDWPTATPRSPRPLERPQRPRCRRSERQKAPCGPATGGARRVDSERAPAVAVRRAARPPHEWLGSGEHARRARACSRGKSGVWAWANARRRPRGAAWAGLGRGARGARACAVMRSANRARLRGAAAGRHGRGIDARRGWEACCKPPPSATRK